MTEKELVARGGSYLVSAIGCSDCHTTKIMTPNGPAPDTSKFLAGYIQDEKLPEVSADALAKHWILFNGSLTSAVGPWGVSFAGNLKSDETGIGIGRSISSQEH